MRKNILLVGLISAVSGLSEAQTRNSETPNDSLKIRSLPDVTVVGRNSKSDYQQMPEVVGTNIYAGKKNALIVLDNVQGNVVTNTMRQVLAKIPGIHIWESDPSGIQVGIAARGLSPNRSWEFNVRQNGYDISADPFGYPEAYYNPQLQAVQRIEIVRGQGSLQYGPQFGGLVNYILRNGGEINKPFQFESQQTVGSDRLFNSYNAIGGKKEKIHYYSFFDRRSGKGWRKNSKYNTEAAFATVSYQAGRKLLITAELMRSHFRTQQPGGLTDQQLYDDATQSLRARNWFDITWTTPALIFDYQINEHARWNTKLFSTIGDRNSVGFLQPVTIKDSININTGEYNNRVVTLDKYRNFGLESRVLTHYYLGKIKNTFSGGLRMYAGKTKRQADGTGSRGSDYDITINGMFPRDINFKSRNAAVFAENIFHFGKLLIIPGIRYEWLEGAASGRNGFNNPGSPIILQNITRTRSFLLTGIGIEYHITGNTEFYGNLSQAYRPIQFANLQAPPTTDMVDPNLKDSKGFNLDLGYRGKLRDILQFDVSLFYLLYNNRIGTVVPAGSNYRLITNVGASTSKGLEGYVEFNPARTFLKSRSLDIILFASYGFTDAKYMSDHKDANTRNKKVENAPSHLVRSGISAGYKTLLITGQFNYVDETYSDANNTETPTANGQSGLIPSYYVTDLSASWKINKKLVLKSGINNLFDKRYFTRRAGGYPGPGALPADGRTFFVSLGIKL